MNVSHETRDILKERGSAFKKYRELASGKVGFLRFLYYEFVITFFSNIPGALGYLLRKIFFKSLFKRIGKGVTFGRGMIIRNPWKIEVGNNVFFDDYTMIDAKTGGIKIGDGCVFARNSTLSCKDGEIEIGNEVNISANVTIYSTLRIKIGSNSFIAGHCYIVAGGEHEFERRDIPIVEQGIKRTMGVEIGEDCWLGASVIVLDGTRLRRGCVVGANSLLKGEYDEYSIIVGSPGKTIRKRGEK